jgi:vacuolar iron transporter family protein
MASCSANYQATAKGTGMAVHLERHVVARIGWLRAAVLGANDGIVSTASLIVGVAASSAGKDAVLVAGLAGLVAGAMSMAAGEYVSVSSQADAEAADLARETRELDEDPEFEHEELAAIYRSRGLLPDLADQVAAALTAHDALGAHARDELGLADLTRARPVQAALASAATFAVGAALPLGFAALLPERLLVLGVAGSALLFLMLLGLMGARTGGAPLGRSVLRVTFWGALALAATWGIGRLLGTTVA